MTPNARFTDFIKDITPSPTTNARSASAHNAVRDALTSDSKYKNEVIRTFLAGSYKRKTAIRPVTKGGDTERPDVDIYVVAKGSTWSKSPSDLIEVMYLMTQTKNGISALELSRQLAVSYNTAWKVQGQFFLAGS